MSDGLWGGGGSNSKGTDNHIADEYITYLKASGEGDNHSSGGGNGGCLSAIIIIGVILFFLYLIGK